MLEIRCPNCGTSVKIGDGNGEVVDATKLNGIGYLVPEKVRNKNKGECHMDKKEARMAALKASGIDVDKFFNAMESKGIHFEDFIEKDPIAEEIIQNGYVRNSKLHRRWIMAQTMRMLNSKGGWTQALKQFDYNYCMDMMIEEIRVISEIEKAGDIEAAEERKQFWTREMIVEILVDYIKALTDVCKHRRVRRCKKVPYIRIGGKNVFQEDVYSKIISPIVGVKWSVGSASSYREMYELLHSFRKRLYIRLPKNTNKSAQWVDSFKGAGAYFTLKNMIMFHNCKIMNEDERLLNTQDSLEELKRQAKLDKDELYKLHGLMKEVIRINHFNFDKVMEEKYKK